MSDPKRPKAEPLDAPPPPVADEWGTAKTVPLEPLSTLNEPPPPKKKKRPAVTDPAFAWAQHPTIPIHAIETAAEEGDASDDEDAQTTAPAQKPEAPTVPGTPKKR